MNGTMDDRVCMITGASSGIGFVLATELARLGACVVMVCRNEERGKKAREQILAKSNNGDVYLMVCDLSPQKAIRMLADEFRGTHDRLHVLINNAAIVPAHRTLTEDGIEMKLAVNHLAPFLLTHLLLDVITGSTPSRIVNVSSEIHGVAEVDFENLSSQKNYNAFSTYATTKLFNLFFTYELARRLPHSTVNCFTPGFTATSLGRDFPFVMRLGMKLFGRNRERSARTGIYLATSEELSAVTGKYFYDMREATSSELSYDRNLAARLWQVSLKLTDLEAFFPHPDS